MRLRAVSTAEQPVQMLGPDAGPKQRIDRLHVMVPFHHVLRDRRTRFRAFGSAARLYRWRCRPPQGGSPEPPDMAVIAIPAAGALDAVCDCQTACPPGRQGSSAGAACSLAFSLQPTAVRAAPPKALRRRPLRLRGLRAGRPGPGRAGRRLRGGEGGRVQAACRSMTVARGAAAPMGILRGRSSSGTSRTRSRCSSPCSSRAPVTSIWSASWNRRSNARVAMPR